MSSKRSGQGGVTLVELIIFIVIVGVALTGLMRVFALNNVASSDPVVRKQALLIAESLLEEVQQAGFTWCDPASASAATATSAAECEVAEGWGPEAGNTRPFDNINDYVSAPGVATAAFNNGAGRVADANGVAFGGAQYTATVTVTPLVLNGIGSAAMAADTDVLRIAVTVSYGIGGSDSLTLEGIRTRYAPKPL